MMAQDWQDSQKNRGPLQEEKKAKVESSLSTMMMSRSGSIDDSTSEIVAASSSALSEPDALSLVLGDMAPAAVGYPRKENLLQQARADRRKWIQKVPLPFDSVRDPDNVWMTEDRLAKVQSAPAYTRLPGATKVLSELYGMEDRTRTPEEVATRIESLIGPLTDEEQSQLDAPTYNSSIDPLDTEEASIVKAYNDFSATLLQPECAMLVQGMRIFFRNLPASTMEEMATSLKSYLEKTNESLKSHVAWKDRSSSMDDLVRRSLDSFVYGNCKPILDSLQWDGLFQMTEQEWTERLLQLQFVQPAHLEIECLLQKEGSNTVVDLDEILKAPKEALLSVDRYYSPFEKLQRILKMYQGVNAALSVALNYQQQQQSGEGGGKERKLPSADDVLPTIILTVLRAQPDRIFRNLQLVEAFCPPEYLRGEAGYAYTNLYGAVQFLQDLDLEHPSSLAISPEDFHKGLEECKASTRKRISALTERSASSLLPEQHVVTKNVDLSVQDVRTARLRGEVVDLEWALQWQKQHPSKGQSTGMKSTAEDDEDLDDDMAEVALPVGFTRSYSFLTSRPENIRLADLPKLLEEYRMLAHTTERLLGERTARFQSKKRRQKSQRKQQLHDRMMQADDAAMGVVTTTTTTTRERVNTS